jgi:hypothetical protein
MQRGPGTALAVMLVVVVLALLALMTRVVGARRVFGGAG